MYSIDKLITNNSAIWLA